MHMSGRHISQDIVWAGMVRLGVLRVAVHPYLSNVDVWVWLLATFVTPLPALFVSIIVGYSLYWWQGVYFGIILLMQPLYCVRLQVHG
jgi:hypothetical protein